MSLLPAVMALFFGGWAIWWGASSVVEGYQSSTWPQTTGTIEESSAGKSPTILYHYRIDGRDFSGSKIDTRGAWNSAASQQVADAYPAGSLRPVFYSPSDPARSILVAGLHRSSFFGVVLGTLILSVGALLGGVGYLAPKYGTTADGRSYSFANDSPIAPYIAFGMLAIFLQFGLLYWIVR